MFLLNASLHENLASVLLTFPSLLETHIIKNLVKKNIHEGKAFIMTIVILIAD